MTNKYLSGTSLVGGSPVRGRVENDFYATPISSVIDLINKENFNIKNTDIVLEPCVGMGHIIEGLKIKYNDVNYRAIDIFNYGYPNTEVQDFLTCNINYKPKYIITNPPFKFAEEFIRKSLSVLDDDGICCMFLKIQFLEGQSRKEFFKEFPPKKIYVFSKRQNPMRNGKETDENGKKWNSTMCFAWFIWEKGYNGKPEIDWI